MKAYTWMRLQWYWWVENFWMILGQRLNKASAEWCYTQADKAATYAGDIRRHTHEDT
jgi:hypothetical protein